MSENSNDRSHLEPLEADLFDDIETVFSTANEMAEKWGYSTSGDRTIAEHYTPDGVIDARYEIHITISKINDEASL
jgi:hypothetical protein